MLKTFVGRLELIFYASKYGAFTLFLRNFAKNGLFRTQDYAENETLIILYILQVQHTHYAASSLFNATQPRNYFPACLPRLSPSIKHEDEFPCPKIKKCFVRHAEASQQYSYI